MSGVRLLAKFPHVATRDCNVCKEFVFNEETGEMRKHNGKPFPRNGPPPCQRCPKKRPDGLIELTPANWRVYAHYLQCRAVNDFPKDGIVRRNAAIISRILDEAHRASLASQLNMAMERPPGV